MDCPRKCSEFVNILAGCSPAAAGNFSEHPNHVRRIQMRSLLAIVAVAVAVSPLAAQQRAMTNADYARAERYMDYNTAPLVAGGAVRPTWLTGDRFVYRVAAADSSGDVMIVDPARGTRARLLDDANLAAAVATTLGSTSEIIRQPSTKNRLS